MLTEKEDEENKIAEAIDRIQRFINYLSAFFLRLFHRKKQILKASSIENKINGVATDSQVCIND